MQPLRLSVLFPAAIKEDEPEAPPHIKEEEEELFPFSPVPVQSEDDEEKGRNDVNRDFRGKHGSSREAGLLCSMRLHLHCYVLV